MTEPQFLALIRRECDKAGSQSAWAAAHGITGAYLTDILRGRRAPAAKLLKAMGYERIVSYRKVRDGGR